MLVISNAGMDFLAGWVNLRAGSRPRRVLFFVRVGYIVQSHSRIRTSRFLTTIIPTDCNCELRPKFPQGNSEMMMAIVAQPAKGRTGTQN